ncbi:MAG: MerR family transcriptional regulator [Spirochaetaceae bacterium]|jgi:DNA-binding transcriptional MerR regulator|nr:MerR family transcriptional regulator [Spirochaetaceae bacterium]
MGEFPVADEKVYRIGELARRANVTTRTVRYYEGLGLLKTQPRTDGGQRCYSDKDLIYITRIVQLKKYGLQLEEIGRIIRMGDEDASGQKRRLELLKQYRVLVSRNLQRIKDIEALVRELEWHMRQLEEAKEDFQACPGSACESCEFASRCEFMINPALRQILPPDPPPSP